MDIRYVKNRDKALWRIKFLLERIYELIRKYRQAGSTPPPPPPIPDDCVDLGLPSGLKWGKHNIGASSETETGKYFQWGDTIGYSEEADIEEHSWWRTCPFNNGNEELDVVYFESVKDTVCPNFTLIADYDAATANLGEHWRLPTVFECQELINNTDQEWVSDFEGSGVSGCKFISRVDSSKYIFFPASGYYLYGTAMELGSSMYIWTKSLFDGGEFGQEMSMVMMLEDGYSDTNSFPRFYGQVMRGVYTDS